MLKPKKSLGQHFLQSPQAIAKIIETAKLSSGDTVLEVGPGKGALTKALLERVGKVVAVEKDESLSPFLTEKFKKELKIGKLELVFGDILTWKRSFQVENYLKRGAYKVVANIPYYITGEFLRVFLSDDFQPKSMTLLLQKEVAERIVAWDGKESILSLSVKAYGMPTYIETVPASEFLPSPKVDSAILHIGAISKDFFKEIDEKNFFFLIKAGFAHKRKLLSGNLGSFCQDRDLIIRTFERCSIPPNTRAESLPLDGWRCLRLSLGSRSPKMGK